MTQNSINTGMPIEVEFGGTGTDTFTLNGILLGNATDPLKVTAALTDGQLLIGSTGNEPVPATLTEGFGIDITNAAGAITIASTGQINVAKVTADTAMALNLNYITDGATLLEMTLPAVIPMGTVFTITDMNSGFRIVQGTGQQINFGTKSTTLGVTGNLETYQDNSSITLMCVTANTIFNVISSVGNYKIDEA